ncbi:protegrin-2-like [Pteronotus mesoamericanus]|uniref:protegrin-2-like n=1 Tax=Pteronotus mesoamericanus TaxID=1884717 RepID=UPI0023ED622F|nr:protegrin-2-like [Pteronotus parnellii mesoamericanus]
MEAQRDGRSWGRWSLMLLLLGLATPPATAQALSYNEAVLRAVEAFNQRSSEASLYRLLQLDSQPPSADEDPNSPKPVSFTVKETVCPRTTQLPPEQCAFQENGLVKQCSGTVTLDQANGPFDINCVNVPGPLDNGVASGLWSEKSLEPGGHGVEAVAALGGGKAVAGATAAAVPEARGGPLCSELEILALV